MEGCVPLIALSPENCADQQAEHACEEESHSVVLGHAIVQREELAQYDHKLLRRAAGKFGAEFERLCIRCWHLQGLDQLLPLPA